jgi:peptidoglycan/LPS O-acetylase OafA/YrhL
MPSENENKVYFPSLNGLRFIAASLVIIYHIEQLKGSFGLPNCWRANPFIDQIGGLGVTLFFVLSGFLITYLLLTEQDRFKAIHLKHFYIRRILRIWPLYYFVIAIGFFIVPLFLAIPGTESAAINSNEKLSMFLFFLPNLSMVTLPMVPFIAHLWSVGVEEQFYLIWPVLLKIFKNKTLNMLIAIVIFMSLLRLLIFHFLIADIFWQRVLDFLGHFRIDCMAVGGVGAWLLFNKQPNILNIIFSASFQITTYVALISALYFGVGFLNTYYMNDLFYSILFVIMLLNLSANKNSILNLESKLLNWLGKISYGLYMYHVIAVVASIKIASFIISGKDSGYLQLLIFVLSFAITIFLSAVSYRYFESRILNFKTKYSFIKSGG